MRVDVTPDVIAVQPGSRSVLSVSIFNDDTVIVAYRLRILGLDPAWVTIDENRLSLFPDASGHTNVALDIPHDAPAGGRRIGVEVTSLTEPAVTEIVEVETIVEAEPAARLQLEPTSIYGTSVGSFGVSATNEGNTPLDVALAGDDPEDHLRFSFDPPRIRLAPGERQHVQVTARGRRPFIGSPAGHTFTVRAVDDERIPPAMGTLIQRAYIGRGALTALGLLAAVTVFAAVLTTSLGRVVDRSRANEDLLLEVLRGESDDPVVENPGGVAGQVTLLTSGAPVSGVTVDLFAADSADRSLQSTATDEAGGYAFGGLAEGDYRVRFRGAGFTELWYPAALAFDDATDVAVAEGETTQGIDVRLGGVPGSIAGTVLGDDVAGATVTLRIPADAIDGVVDAVVKTTVVDATGQFLLEDVPAPSSYVLGVDKPGFASEIRLVNIAAAEAIEGIEISLRTGDGSISGTVRTDAGPLGAARIVATAGEVQLTTASLTQDGVGTFTLRNVPTPATYTIQVSADGFTTETFAVSIGTGQQLTGIDVSLRGGTGSVSGRVSVAGQGPTGGITVTVSDGSQTFRSETLSVGDVGSYRVDDLPLPGTYTVTFARDGLATQTRSIDLDAFGGGNLTGVNATLTPALGIIRGVVNDENGAMLGGVSVTATSGDITRVTTSANSPAGAYELRNLPPGTYTVTFQRPGSLPRAVLVALGAGETRTVDATLSPQASIRGTVTVNGSPTGGLQVRIFRIETYPTQILATVNTQVDGSYAFEALDAPQTYIIEYLNAGGSVVASRTVTLSAGEQAVGVDVDLP
ncbi:MAG: carboxypeptidase regulatory-like domain-containing protein [Acidimicrobiales bacterium]